MIESYRKKSFFKITKLDNRYRFSAVEAWLRRRPTDEISSDEKILYSYLFQMFLMPNYQPHISRSRIAQECGFSDRYRVRKLLNRLKEKKLLELSSTNKIGSTYKFLHHAWMDEWAKDELERSEGLTIFTELGDEEDFTSECAESGGGVSQTPLTGGGGVSQTPPWGSPDPTKEKVNIINKNINNNVVNTVPTPPNKLKKRTKTRVCFKKEEFEELWNLYPGSGSKKKSAEEWSKHRPDDELVNTMRQAIINQIEWRKESREFYPNWKHFERWLNKECWNEKRYITQSRQKGPTADKINEALNNMANKVTSPLGIMNGIVYEN